MAAEESLRKMVETIKKDKGYKILTSKEYEDLLARASTSGGGIILPVPQNLLVNRVVLNLKYPLNQLSQNLILLVLVLQSNQQNMSAYAPTLMCQSYLYLVVLKNHRK